MRLLHFVRNDLPFNVHLFLPFTIIVGKRYSPAITPSPLEGEGKGGGKRARMVKSCGNFGNPI
jgi:hypothetical protein